MNLIRIRMQRICMKPLESDCKILTFPLKFPKKKTWFPLHQLGVAAGRLDISHQLPPFLLQLLAFLLAHLQLTGKIHTAQLGLLAPGRTAIETESSQSSRYFAGWSEKNSTYNYLYT